MTDEIEKKAKVELDLFHFYRLYLMARRGVELMRSKRQEFTEDEKSKYGLLLAAHADSVLEIASDAISSCVGKCPSPVSDDPDCPACRLQNFIAVHGGHRFECWNKRHWVDASGLSEDDSVGHWRPVTLAGWKKYDPQVGSYTYFITPEVMRNEVLVGMDYRLSVKFLADIGLVVKDCEGRSTVPAQPPRCNKMRLFQINNMDGGSAIEGQ